MKRVILLLCIFLSTVVFPSRLSERVIFNLSMPTNIDIVPFTVIVPENFRGQFVRFVHPSNGKSAVAKVLKREGGQYKTNPDLASAIGIQSTVARIFVEEVY